MFKNLKNQDGFGLVGLLIVLVIIGIMSAMILPTFTAKIQYTQARYVAGVTKTIANAENAYMAKNSSFADLVTLSQNGYLSPQFLQALQPANNPGGPYPQPNWITLNLANQTVNLCIDNNGGCPDNPSGNNYFIGLYSVPVNFANYLAHELPGSGIGSQSAGLDYLAYSAPVPSAPPVNIPDNGATPAAKYSQSWLNPGYYTWTVPSGVTVIGVSLEGANGGNGSGSSGGQGGYLKNQLVSVYSGQTIQIYVGQNGQGYSSYGSAGGWGYAAGGNGSGGYNGNATYCKSNGTGAGGGSSAIVNPSSNIIIMAPGGGGGGSCAYYHELGGGGGGYNNGSDSWGYGGDVGGGGGGYGGGGNSGNYYDAGGNGGFYGGTGFADGGNIGILPSETTLGGFVMIQWN